MTKKVVMYTMVILTCVLIIREPQVYEAEILGGGLQTMYNPKNSRITVYVYKEQMGSHENMVKSAVYRWNKSGLLNMRYTTNSQRADIIFIQSRKRFPGKTVLAETYPCRAFYDTSNTRKCTKVSSSSRWDFAYIIGYPYEMNEAQYTWSNRRNTYMHEIGHAIGLAHPSSYQCSRSPTSSVMCSGRTKSSYPTRYDKQEFHRKWDYAREREKQRLQALGQW